MAEKKETKNFMTSVATFIVDKRNLFFLIFAILCIFSLVSSNWVEVENDISEYLDENTETRRGLDVMDREFVTYATADIMISNISYDRALDLSDEIENIKGVSKVDFDDSTDHMNKASALLSVTFDGTTDDQISHDALNKIKEKLKDYDTYVSSEVGDSSTDSLNGDMNIILCIAAVIITLVLLFTSRSYAEVPVLLITFIAAALLNKGTNFMLGRISFISNSVAVVLQLALAIDYAIILCHRFTEEREIMPVREAAITALSKAIIEISSSSLTTISGLLALMVMHFGIGRDLSIVMVKAIFMSLLSVFTLMPGLLVVFSKYMEKTVHKNFVPEINMLGKAVIKTKYILPPIFVVVAVAGAFFSNMCPYAYGQTDLSTFRKNEYQITRDKIRSVFKRNNTLAVIVPAGNYDKEARLIAELDGYDEIDSITGLANSEAMDGYMLTDKLNPREFSELAEVDYSAAKLLYAAYAADNESYGHIINNLDSYTIPLIDSLEFLHKELAEGYISFDKEKTDDINEIHDTIVDAKKQLQSDKYSRIVINLSLPEEGEETFAFLDKMHEIIGKYYQKDVYLVGNSMNDYDLASSFSQDNVLISVLSAVFVIIVLLFTFMSAGLPILLIAIIQGSIWINFSFPYLTGSKLFFLGYLIVNAIQMGANIDYAIVISNRYSELKREMPINKAIITALNQSFPTIITSGTILVAAGFLIGFISTNGVISAMGQCLGRGTTISIVLVMCVLPQILLLGDTIIEKTSFSIKKPDLIHRSTGTVFVNGRVRGHISGLVDAEIHGVIKGDVNAMVDSGNINQGLSLPSHEDDADADSGGADGNRDADFNDLDANGGNPDTEDSNRGADSNPNTETNGNTAANADPAASGTDGGNADAPNENQSKEGN